MCRHFWKHFPKCSRIFDNFQRLGWQSWQRKRRHFCQVRRLEEEGAAALAAAQQAAEEARASGNPSKPKPKNKTEESHALTILNSKTLSICDSKSNKSSEDTLKPKDFKSDEHGVGTKARQSQAYKHHSNGESCKKKGLEVFNWRVKLWKDILTELAAASPLPAHVEHSRSYVWV